MIDLLILGGGIVGLSAAYHIQQRFPDKKIVLLEKESGVALHQTGHNSGVIHSGIYYQPGSFKAKFCAAGNAAIYRYCEEFAIPYRKTGKLIVATNLDEQHRLHQLSSLAQSHGIAAQTVTESELKELEPAVRGLSALNVASTGIVDYLAMSRSLADQFIKRGGHIQFDAKLLAIRESVNEITVVTTAGEFSTQYLLACCGLQADRIARQMGVDIDFRIVPMRGEYYQLSDAKKSVVSRPIYPVPEPKVPFLGVHITPMINGSVTVGPNAVLGFKREGYSAFNFSMKDSADTFLFPGFWRMLQQHWQFAVREGMDSLIKSRYLRSVQKYCPSITGTDLQSYPAGIRAQAVTRDGKLLNDFLFGETARSLHVCSAASPAATACFPIGQYLCDKMAKLW